MVNRSHDGSDDGATDIAKLGEQLKALREAQKLSYEDVSRDTKVRPHLLQAIENGTIEESAAPVYARGFVKTYCEYLLAGDLWRKYSCCLSSPDAIKPANEESAVDINHPTPIFRRSSIIWVYVLLVIAVLAAAFLLWSQQRDREGFEHGFFLRIQDRERIASSDEVVSADSTAPAVILSPDVLATPLPAAMLRGIPEREGASEDVGAPPVDLSWMGGVITVTSGEYFVPTIRQVASRQELLIEITGRKTRLVVNQGGKNVTTRELTAGDSRTYYVKSDTEVRLGVGNAADVTWFGMKYETVGSDENPLSLIFYPDGSVMTTSGNSRHFSSERQFPR